MGNKDKKGNPGRADRDKSRNKAQAGQKRQRDTAAGEAVGEMANGGPAAATEAPSTSGRPYTVSIAVGASCVENAQNLQLATLLAGQVARAAAVFNVDEVVVVDDAEERVEGSVSAAAALFARVLQFMETPQYLKKALIPMHPDLKFAGVLPPLDAPHHLRSTEWGPYREGVVRSSDPATGSLIDVGLEKDAWVEQAVRPSVRITLAMGPEPTTRVVGGKEVLVGRLALPSEPRDQAGLYWGYTTRIASGLQDMLEGGPFPGGYDLKVGTSERGERVPACELDLGPFRHLLLAFGGPEGLEACLAQDPLGGWHADPRELFDRYLNTCFDQGSRTIRTEEAVLISAAFLQPALQRSARQAAGA